MTSHDLTPKQWEQLREAAELRYRWAFEICEWLVDHGVDFDDPLYQASGQMLRACIDLKNMAEKGMRGEPIKWDGPKYSMMMWVRPHCDGGFIPGSHRPLRRR